MTAVQTNALVVLRVLIGWHFLYEGVVKIMNPNWTSTGYLIDSQGLFADWFLEVTLHPTFNQAADIIIMWGMIAIGLGMILGLFSRAACVGGMVMLALFYLSHPPLLGVKYAQPTEGAYLLIDKNLIEFVAIAVLTVFPTSRIIGLDRILFPKKNQ